MYTRVVVVGWRDRGKPRVSGKVTRVGGENHS